ncbi:alpha-amylase family glycosyl hydrolase [Demequina sp. SO4-18]|uniref:alpha-amylase family glycosyl hydrolase n=1 Tax=Demequina sp. SO4-18 TaxID=3401026 RepID=UPI003B590015
MVTNSALARALAPHIAVLTGDAGVASDINDRLLDVAARHRETLSRRQTAPLTERSAFLIAYGDSIRREGERPLRTLRRVLDQTVADEISDVHLLPIFPWTSDDGFAVVDYREVDPQLGDWGDVESLGRTRGIALDFVANHLSASSPWFREWLAGSERRRGYFIQPSADFDTSAVVRPRTTDLVHEYPRQDGTLARAWTTFGPDQVDLNVAEPAVLAELTDVLLTYVARGADTIRLDAIGYLWKDSGTSCIHRPGTHAIIKMWRAMLDELAPGVRLLTETNVPHRDNVSYFGNLTDEAHMVYQFALPPLVLHSFVSGSSGRLTRWAASLEDLGSDATWFTFLASHDGVGLRPTLGILDDAERAALVRRAESAGGRAAHATEPDGSRSVYELNVNYLDALVDDEARDDPRLVVRRGLAAHAILLAMVGVPAIYLHSLYGSTGDIEGMVASGINRRINREKLDADALLDETVTSPRRRGMLEGIVAMLRVRREQPAFDPYSPQEVLDLGDQVVALRRGRGHEEVTAVVNVSRRDASLPMLRGHDLLTGARHEGVTLPPDGVLWLARE